MWVRMGWAERVCNGAGLDGKYQAGIPTSSDTMGWDAMGLEGMGWDGMSGRDALGWDGQHKPGVNNI